METKTIRITKIKFIPSKLDGQPIGANIIDEKELKYIVWFQRNVKDKDGKPVYNDDGTPVKEPSIAKQAWDGFKLKVDSTITIRYSEEEKSFIKDGKTLKYIERRVANFLQEITPQSRMAQRVAELPPSPATDGEREIDVSQIPF